MSDQKSNARQHLTAAVLAVAQHLVDHDLPAPFSIGVDHGSAEVTLWISDRSMTAYLETLTVLDRVSNTDPLSAICAVRVSCVLPDTGIQVLVRSARLEETQP